MFKTESLFIFPTSRNVLYYFIFNYLALSAGWDRNGGKYSYMYLES